MSWIIEADSPAVVVVEDGPMVHKYIQYMDVVKLFLRYQRLYSWDYMTLMQTELTNLGFMRMRSTEAFLEFLNSSKVSFNASSL